VTLVEDSRPRLSGQRRAAVLHTPYKISALASHEQIRAIKDKYAQQLLGKRGVSGVGIEKNESGEYELVVHLDDPSAQTDLPKELDGHAVRYVVSGRFRKL